MRFGVGNAGRQRVAPAVLLAVLVTGCSGADGETAGEAAGRSATATATAEPARRGATVGAAGSACELPVTFDTARSWKAEAVDAGQAGESGGDLAELADAVLHQGPVTMVCEIDAKPAGHIGFLRVWTGRPGDAGPREVLAAFVAAGEDASEEKYRTFTSGDVTGTEVEYLTTSEALDEPKKERALAVVTADGPVVLHLGGLDSQEHEEMLPAYELARDTLRTTA
ncbi:lipoprotein [Streptomyces sp. NPDC002588]|uniref:lipoprotein n=1 Tax=Streptomyces sp. NPDC002588 TaxID=3154419 RepID=UPI00331C29AE